MLPRRVCSVLIEGSHRDVTVAILTAYNILENGSHLERELRQCTGYHDHVPFLRTLYYGSILRARDNILPATSENRRINIFMTKLLTAVNIKQGSYMYVLGKGHAAMQYTCSVRGGGGGVKLILALLS